MPEPVHSYGTGVKSGLVSQWVLNVAGIQGSLPILGVRMERDAASGMASGKRQHKPITIFKEWDESSPQLLGLMHFNTSIPRATINWGDDDWLAFLDGQITNISQNSVGGRFVQAITIEFNTAEAGTGAGGHPVNDQQEMTRVLSGYYKMQPTGGVVGEPGGFVYGE